MPRIIITTGGTGGHIFPAIAVADALRASDPEIDILFIGSNYGPEKRLASQAGLPFKGLPSRGVLGRGLRAIPAACGLTMALIKALAEIRAYKPNVIAAFGGYACFPAALAAKLLKKPLLLHEQNAIAGACNQLIGKWADTICVSLPHTRGFNKDYIVTGNPVRHLERRESRRAEGGRNLLILGGSQGAHKLNQYIVSLLNKLKENKINLLHQTGEKDFGWVRQEYKKAGYAETSVQPFIDDMGEAYHWADLAFCRSGASTIAELSEMGLGAILVPFPAAIHDHQTLNARIMAENDAALLIPESTLDPDGANLLNLINNKEKLIEMGKAAARLGQPHAASVVAKAILNLV